MKLPLVWASLLVLMLLVLPLLPAGAQTPSTATTACANEIASKFDAALAAVNQTSATLLAEQSSEFSAAVAGHIYEFDSVGGVAKYVPGTCGNDLVLGQLNVGFSIEDKTVNSGGVTVQEGVTAYEKPSLTAVTNVTVDDTVQGITYWSGYQAQYFSGGSAQRLYTDELTINVPSVSYNTNCYHASPYQCEMSIWAGLSNSYGGGGFLLQSGVDFKVPCTGLYTCSSTVYTAWYEWVPHNAATPCGSSYPVYYNDQVTPFEENGQFTGGNGNSNDYQAFVEDATQAWVCGSGWYDIASPAYYAQSIDETPSNGCCPIPTSTTNKGNWYIGENLLCYSTTSSYCVWWGTSNTRTSSSIMNNYCTALGQYINNINVGTTFDITGGYNQQYNNNCDF